MVKKIKIVSNPYKKEIKYLDYNESSNTWEDIVNNNPNSKLRENNSEKTFLPFKFKDIIDIIIDEYYSKSSKVELHFEGTTDEFIELREVCNDSDVSSKINLIQEETSLENARIIFPEIKDFFKDIEPDIYDIIKDDEEVKKKLKKVSDALNDIVPICVFGNYSSGKSTFINALIGYEILPSGGDPITSKIYKIVRSNYSDVAKIEFTLNKEKYVLSFDNNIYSVKGENQENELILKIQEALDKESEASMVKKVNVVLSCINSYEKEKKADSLLDSVIEVEIPFSSVGPLGKSHSSNYVIFDTPGSNSETNITHTRVLKEALDNFSNGIPVWISTYETLDSTDNASLCEKVSEIEALDNRFTMIILNKADVSDLTEDNFAQEQINDILSFNSVDKMYAGGIYFVSSIMALGAKTENQFIDQHYRKIYRSQQNVYSNPDDEDYTSLYKFNIMPKQIKENAIRYSEECSDTPLNLIYANSGLLCVENEIERFASRYALYNKCKMVNSFLNKVINKTNETIKERTETWAGLNKDLESKLHEGENKLRSKIISKSTELKNDYENQSYEKIKEYKSKYREYIHTIKEMEDTKKSLDDSNSKEKNFDVHKQKYDDAKSKMVNHMKLDIKQMLKDGFVDSVKNKVDSIQQDISTINEKRNLKDKLEKDIDCQTADKLLEIITEDYKKSALLIRDTLLEKIKRIWKDNTLKLKENLINIVKGDGNLPQTQKDEISEIIINFDTQKIDDDADNIFIKSKYLEGKIFGFRISDTEEINVKKLTNSYNSKIRKLSESLADRINRSCMNSFERWKTSLVDLISNNLTRYNQELRKLTDRINECDSMIIKLKTSQDKISTTINEIEDLMSWENID